MPASERGLDARGGPRRIVLALGEQALLDDRLYGRCAACGQVIRVNKPLLGSLHLCTIDEEVIAVYPTGPSRGAV